LNLWNEIGAKFRIPLEKISEVIINEKTVEIKFIDGEGLNTNYLLNNVDEKGKNIMNSLKKY
jgi:hypothetical protein